MSTYRDQSLTQNRSHTSWSVTRDMGEGRWYKEGCYYSPYGIADMYWGNDGAVVTFVWQKRWHRRSWNATPMTQQGMSMITARFIKEIVSEKP